LLKFIIIKEEILKQ